MSRHRKPGYAALALLKALKDGNRYGLDLMAETDLPSGTVYPQLGRLERRGYVRAEWEPEDIARMEARPRRRYYEITDSGIEMLQQALAVLRQLTAEDVRSTETALGDT